MKKDTTAKKIGRGLAYFQDTVDRIVTFGFRKLKNAGAKKAPKNENVLKKSARKTASFLGEMGAEFYEKYEEIKQKRGSKRSKKK